MAQLANRHIPHGLETRSCLHRLLLAIDAPALCGRCHESSLDCPACDFCFIGARRTKTLVSGASIRAGSRRVGNIDVALLAANCRLNIGALRHRESRTPGWTEDLTPRRKDAKDAESLEVCLLGKFGCRKTAFQQRATVAGEDRPSETNEEMRE